jgi:hypothetical protein
MFAHHLRSLLLQGGAIVTVASSADALAPSSRGTVEGLTYRSERYRVYADPWHPNRRPVHAITPIFPESLRNSGQDYGCVIQAEVRDDGVVLRAVGLHKNSQPLSGTEALLDSVGVAAVQQWRFEPWRETFEPRERRPIVAFKFKTLSTTPDQEGCLTVVVTDSDNGAPVPSPNGQLSPPVFGTWDFRDGAIEFRDVASGRYRLKVFGFGYRMRDTLVEVSRGLSNCDTLRVALLRK